MPSPDTMHIKFLPHSKGSGRAAAAYLLGDLDHQGQARADVQVLRGNPAQLGELIDSLESVHRYTSGVMAFHIDDDPTDAEIQHALDEFERVAFAGLEKNQFTWCAVLHEEADGSKHVHFVVPRVELTSGNALNIAPPGWKKTFDPLRDALNFEHGWARPDDPRLARQVQPGRVAQWAGWRAGEDPRQLIHEWLSSQVLAGLVNSRADVLAALAGLGEINRQGKDYISIRTEPGAKPIRLKGPIYGDKFDGESFRKDSATAESRPRGREKPDRESAEIARRQLEKTVGRRAEYNAQRYPAARDGAGETAQLDRPAPALADVLASVVERVPVDFDRFGSESVGLVDSDPGQQSVGQNTIRPADEIRADEHGVLQQSSGKKILQTIAINSYPINGEKNDRAREIVEGFVSRAQQAARRAAGAVSRAAAAAGRAAHAVGRACRAVDTTAPAVRVNMTDELDRFKSEISLIDYACAEFGYELQARESSKSSKVLKCGGDKIIVTRQDGHDVYFSTGDDRDNGSVIDFLQRRKSLNLGQVRKELRQWLPGAKRPALQRPARAPEHAQAVTKDRAGVIQMWDQMRPYNGSYLTRERGIDPAIIREFDVKQDAHGNACFAHKDHSGITGWESKNNGFTGFAIGGDRRITWNRIDDFPLKKIVICEAAIDCMSYCQLGHEPGTGYMSTSGTQLNQEQREQLAGLLSKAAGMGAKIVLAMDNDAAGERMAAEIAQIAPQGAEMAREIPAHGKDWNDALRADLAAQAAQQLDRRLERDAPGLRM